MTEIREAIASWRDEILDFAKELVAIPTENPPGRSYRACVEAIELKLREIGLESTVLQVPAEGPSCGFHTEYPRYCLLSSYGDGAKVLYFHGHYDVVPARSEAQFRPRVEGARLYGRGSADMKGGLAAMVYAVRAVKEAGPEFTGRIGLAIVPDEETGGALGARYLADAGLLGQDGVGMLLPEPTSGVVWNANRGAISLRVKVKGRPAHVALHYEGVNAFEQMLVVAQALAGLKAEVETRKTRFRIEPEAARRSILMMGGRCEGGTIFNLVPDECSFTVDRRINPEESLEAEKQRLFGLFERLKGDGIDLDVEVLQEGESAGVREDIPLAQALAESIADVVGRRPVFEMCPGLLETRLYVRQGVPALAYGPGLLSVSHSPDEFVEVERLYDCAVIYALTAVRALAS